MSYNQEYAEIFQSSPFGQTIVADNVLEDMSFFDDWEERYRYVIDLGKQLVDLPDEKKSEDFILHGCQSQVWVDHFYDAEKQKLYFLVATDAHIVKGLSAIVLSAFNGRSPQEVVSYDVEKYLDELALIRHVSPTRGNGLRSMVGKMQSIADRYQNENQ